MGVTQQRSPDGRRLTLEVCGHFDFELEAEFRSAYERLPRPPEEIEVDLCRTQMMDSSALGMLLVLREYARRNNAEVSLKHNSPTIARVLRIANFQKLFRVA